METFLIDVPMPSMGATVNELTVIALKVETGARVAKGQKIAELESDKSIFEFESPCDGTVRSILATAGEVKAAGSPFLQIDTSDDTLRHLAAKAPAASRLGAGGSETGAVLASAPPQWTPRAIKLAQEAGLVPSQVTDIEATGPGNRVSGDDLTRYLAKKQPLG